MSYASLVKLATLCGAENPPPRSLYHDSWPSRLERTGRIAHNLFLKVRGRARYALAVTGAKLPACTGEVRLTPARSQRIADPRICILPGATEAGLADSLDLDLSTEPVIHLADCGVLVVIGRRRGDDIVIHVVDEPDRAQRYVEGCQRAVSALQPIGLGHLAPRILARKSHTAGEMIESSGLPGKPVKPRDLPSERLLGYISAALTPLTKLVRPGRPLTPPDEQLVIRITHALDSQKEFSALRSWGIPAWNGWRQRQERDTTIAHGDYWLSNILFGSDTPPEVSGIVDWERSRESAVVGIDALQMVSMSFAHWRNCDPISVLCMIWSDKCEPTLEQCLELVMGRFRLTPADIGYLALQSWLMHLAQHAADSNSWSSVRWREWVSDPSDYAQRWLATQTI